MKGSRVIRRFGTFARDRSAATAVEFSLIAFPFFISLLGIFEISNMYFAATTLENGTDKVSRKVRTGQVQASNMSQADFKQLLCNEVSDLLTCDERLQIDVRTYQQFNQADFTPPLNPDGTVNMAFQFNPGSAGDVVLVRAFYVWEIATPFFGGFLSNMAGGTYLMTSAAAFRNEPFTAGSGSWNGT